MSSSVSIIALILLSSAAMMIRSALVPVTHGPACTWNGQQYNNGEKWNPDPCTFCTCEGGRPICAVADCALPSCVDMVHDADQCCPTCPNGPNCRASDGTVIPAGQVVNITDRISCHCPTSGFFMGPLDAICIQSRC